MLTVKSESGATVDLPATADAATGGFLIDTAALKNEKVDSEATGTLRGYWGFQTFAGPNFHLRSAHATKWVVPAPDETALVVGREDAIHLRAQCAACVNDVTAKDEQGNDLKTAWAPGKTDELEVKLAVTSDSTGQVKILVKQFGLDKPDELALRAYSEAPHVESFVINAGDRDGVLKGTRLDQVASLELSSVRFSPAT